MSRHFDFTVLDSFEVSLTASTREDQPEATIAERLNSKEAYSVLKYLRDRQDERGWTMEGTENLRGLSRDCTESARRVTQAIRVIERGDEGFDGLDGSTSPITTPPPVRPYREPSRNVG